MPEQRATATSRLMDVIQLIRLGHRTGVLTVERGEGATFEEGSISFVNGQVTQASAGYRRGVEALNWLSSWGSCLFSFLQSASTTGEMQLPSQPPDADYQDLYSAFPVYHTPNTGGIEPVKTTGPLPVSQVLRRLRPGEEALSLISYLGLSRAHRQIFLLIDGHRSAIDLIRLTNQEPDKVYRILDDLNQAGLIQQ